MGLNDSEKKRYYEMVGSGKQDERGVVEKGKYSPAEALMIIERERASQTAGQEQKKYKKIYPQKTTTPPRPKPAATTQDKKPSLLGRLARGFVAVSKNMQEAESWKRKHVVGYNNNTSIFGSSREEKRHTTKKQSPHDKKMRRFQAIDTAKKLGISVRDAYEYNEYKHPSSKKSSQKKKEKHERREEGRTIFGSIFGSSKMKKPRSIF